MNNFTIESTIAIDGIDWNITVVYTDCLISKVICNNKYIFAPLEYKSVDEFYNDVGVHGFPYFDGNLDYCGRAFRITQNKNDLNRYHIEMWVNTWHRYTLGIDIKVLDSFDAEQRANAVIEAMDDYINRYTEYPY